MTTVEPEGRPVACDGATQRLSYPDALRGAGIILVVATHSLAYLNPRADAYWVTACNAATLPLVAVFFLVDGWLHARRCRSRQTTRDVVRSLSVSCRRLLIPWVIFSAIYLACRLTAERYGLVHGASVVPDWPDGLLMAFWRGSASGQMYFLPALLVVRAASLLMHPFIRGRPLLATALAIATIAAWRGLIGPALDIPPADPLSSAGFGLGFAAIGWALFEAEHAGMWLGAPGLAAIAAGCAALMLPAPFGRYAWQVGYTLVLWVMARNLAGYAPHRWLEALGRRSMQIYLLHGPYPIRIAAGALVALLVPGPAALAIGIACSIALSLGIAWVISRLGMSWVFQGSGTVGATRGKGVVLIAS